MKKIIFSLLVFPLLAWARGGDGSGGGSLIQGAFRLRATALINKVHGNPAADAICPFDSLAYALFHTPVNVVDVMHDPDTQAIITAQDAWTGGGQIQLLSAAWKRLPELDSGARMLVNYDFLILHELFRATGGACNDDNFALSARVFPILDEPTNPEPTYTSTIQNVSVSGASNWVTQTNQFSVVGTVPTQISVTNLTIYGGLAGRRCEGSLPGLCNSCGLVTDQRCANSAGENQAPLCACNLSRIQDETMLTITVSPTDRKGRVHLVGGGSTSGSVVVGNGIGADLAGSSPQLGSVSVPWSSICASISGSPSCEGKNLDGTLQLWVDNNVGNPYEGQYNASGPYTNATLAVHFVTLAPSADESVFNHKAAEGMAQFTPFPGDERIYLTNIATPVTFPALAEENSSVTGIQIYASSTSLDGAIPGSSASTQTVAVNGTGFFDRIFLDGLTNGSSYFVRIGMLDQANNILQFYPGQNDVPSACHAPSADPANCPFAVHLPGR